MKTYNKKDFKPKKKDAWSIFKIMGEFVNGYEKLSAVGPCVSIFGSARTKPDNQHYQLGVDVARAIAEKGYGIITGGGPGIMEAGNKGAQLANGVSVGLNIHLPFEQSSNPYIDPEHNLNFEYFFVRKVMFVKFAQAFVVLPGGVGTLDELFEALTLVQTNKIKKIPIILVQTTFWSGLVDWMKNTLVAEGMIHADDLNLIHLVDSKEDVLTLLDEFYSVEKLKPNF
ncbi:TIGR00730 family Rossman fold protein [Flavobacteriaceae bacterium]|nr:TIGR00730 family Rossman fold protein [Flavobacteriaceae bacterium]MDA9294301.1 TIGR00730 family Rossman fold protein [Flavobacteriaceae bacterium]MDB4187711.1 TIGR00730 family Rossman fold protein [Flavobacteriaceae bacterium]MDB9886601.1 TIGR00730 family Rossman fold protein [Flavobacteriaceae bacterium]